MAEPGHRWPLTLGPVPLDQWGRERDVLEIPRTLRHFRARGPYDGVAVSSSDRLLWADTAAGYVVAVYCIGPRTAVALVKAGIVRRYVRIRAPYPDEMDPNDHDRLEFELGVATAELAVRTLRERRAAKPTTTDEAWLRRQLEGLGGSA